MLAETDRIHSIVFAFVCVLALSLNLSLVLLNASRALTLPPSSFLLVALCLTDSINVSNGLVNALTHLIRDSIDHNVLQCQHQSAVTLTCTCTSLLLCTGLPLVRYLIVIREWNLSDSFARYYLALSVFLSSLVGAVPFIIGTAEDTYVMSTTGLICTIRWTDLTFSTKVTATAAGFLFLVSLLFMAYAYARIYHRVRKVFTLFNTLHGVSEEGKMTVQARMRASSETTMTAASKSKVRQRVLLVQSVVIVALFVCCWTPYVAVAIIGLVKGTQTVDSGEPDIEFVFFAEMMMLMHAVLNPIVVCVFDQDLLKVIVVRGSGQVYRPLRPLISPPTLFPHGNVHC